MILKNKMEVICWEHNVIPVIIICHSGAARQYVYSHWHKELEISWLFKGEVEFYNGGKRRLIKNNGINLVNSEELHYAIPRKESWDSEENVGITIQLNYAFLKGLIPDLDELYFEIPSDSVEGDLTERMGRIYELYTQGDGPEMKLKILAIVCELIAVLYEKCRNRKSIVPVNEQKDRERIKIIIEYLNTHYKEKLQQQELAKKFHFSREYFARFFKQQTGMTFKEYLTHYRLGKAMDELLYSDKKVLDIAWNNGFTSESQFISCFKNAYKVTPSVYRNLNRQKPASDEMQRTASLNNHKHVTKAI